MNVKRIFWVLAAALAILLAGTAQVSWAAMDAYMVIKGEKQGQFKGTGTGASTGKVSISEFSYMASAPQDKATAQTSGKRMHSAITIVKEVDQASPQLMQAMRSGEVLTSVDIEFVHPGAKGPEVYKTIHLTNAMVTSVQVAGGPGAGKSESITITAESQNVEMRNKNGGKTGIDDWMAQK